MTDINSLKVIQKNRKKSKVRISFKIVILCLKNDLIYTKLCIDSETKQSFKTNLNIQNVLICQ